MKKVLQNNEENRKLITELPKVYIIGCWARWGVRGFPFVKLNKNLIPLVYNYNDYNGTADQWELIPITYTTTGYIFDWSFSEERAKYIAELFNKQQAGVEQW